LFDGRDWLIGQDGCGRCVGWCSDERSPSPSLEGRGIGGEPCCDRNGKRRTDREARQSKCVTEVCVCTAEDQAAGECGGGDERAEPEEVDHGPAGEEPEAVNVRELKSVHGMSRESGVSSKVEKTTTIHKVDRGREEKTKKTAYRHLPHSFVFFVRFVVLLIFLRLRAFACGMIGIDQLAKLGQFGVRKFAGFDEMCGEAAGGAVEDAVDQLAEHRMGGGGLGDGGGPQVAAAHGLALDQVFIEHNAEHRGDGRGRDVATRAQGFADVTSRQMRSTTAVSPGNASRYRASM